MSVLLWANKKIGALCVQKRSYTQRPLALNKFSEKRGYPSEMSTVMSTNSSKAKGLSLFAHRIDEQLCNLLLTQLSSSLEEVEGGLSERWKPECRVLVLLIFYSLSLLSSTGTDNNLRGDRGIICTPGMRTMNLSCHSSTSMIVASSGITGTVLSLLSTLKTHFLVTTNAVTDQPHHLAHPSLSSRVQHHWQGLVMILYLLCSYTLERGQRMALLQGWSQAPRDSLKHRMHRCLQVIHHHHPTDYLLATDYSLIVTHAVILTYISHTMHSLNSLLTTPPSSSNCQSDLLLHC